jgi:excisionase family DNA binding protein
MMDSALTRPPDAAAEPLVPHSDERVLSVNEVAGRLRVHPTTIYRQLNTHTFPVRAFRVGRSWRIDARAFDRWLTEP